jgi:hypothetical protein
VKSMQSSKIVVNIIFWSQNYGKITDDYIYIYMYIHYICIYNRYIYVYTSED